jgi:hypothetical protein
MPPDTAKIIQTKVQLQAGSSIFKVWPGGGKTWHYGEGFIEPLGMAQYWCGKEFPEQKSIPQPDYLKALKKAFSGDMNDGEMLFCVYRLEDGDLYAYDSPIGTLHSYEGENNPRMEQTMNIVVGGTSAYKGTTGVWLGVVEGRGKSVFPAGTGAQVPEVLLKLMDGYVRVPNAAPAVAATCPPYPNGGKFDAAPIVDAIDTNHDNRLTHAEWQKAGAPEGSWNRFMGYPKVKQQGYVSRQDFETETPPNGVDANCDGKITLAEFLEFSKQMGGGPPGPPGAKPN